MTCARCGFGNPDGMGFCGQCGVALAVRVCRACSYQSPVGFAFCGKCGATLAEATTPAVRTERRGYTPRHLIDKVLTTRDALKGERKQVTVLFADVKESLSLAEQIDPETWHQVLDRFFAILSDGVHRFEGTVNQYTGDGIMALFGAPVAHEDHAQRACHAAWELRDVLRQYADSLRLRGLNFSVRMGINSGEVVVGTIGDDLRMDYTAQGHTVGLAARMEQIAEPGKVYLTQYTARLVEGFFLLRDLGEAQVKGVADPVRVFELEGFGPHRSRFEVARARGLSRFVGRGDELDSLEAALRRATAGDGQVVGLVGEAGVGKSRLSFELLERCRARAIPVAQAHATAHGKSMPLMPMRALLRAIFALTDDDTEATARDRVAGRLLRLAPETTEMLPLIYDCLGIPEGEDAAPPTEGEARQEAFCRVVKALLQAHGRREVHVQLLEDLHWFDAESEAVVAACVEAVAESRCLLLVNFRPDYRADWMAKSYYQQIALRPLTRDAIGELLTDLLGDDPSLAPLETMIRERTQGNPFFVEEIVRSMVEAGALDGSSGQYRLTQPLSAFAVPATVQATLTARIDRLTQSAKVVLQTAAVIGKEFNESLLQRVAECPPHEIRPSLERLARAEFISERAAHPERVYAFKHPLTLELAYRSQLADRRAGIHEAVAQALEETHATRLGEQAALLAHHWEAANKPNAALRWRRRAALQVTAIQVARRRVKPDR